MKKVLGFKPRTNFHSNSALRRDLEVSYKEYDADDDQYYYQDREEHINS